MKYQAHRGVSTEAPENTVPAVELAIKQGYAIIELDVDITRDGRFVLLHDRTLNRTARNADGSELDGEMRLADVTYDEAQKYDFGLWLGEQFRGTRLPLFEDVLTLVKQSGRKIKIDNKHQRFSDGDRDRFFELLSGYQDTAELTFKSLDALIYAVSALPEASFHYDGTVDEKTLSGLSEILPRERLTVWLPYENRHTEWAKVPFLTEELAAKVNEVARLGVWLLSEQNEAEAAERLSAYVIETNGTLKPKITVADMHTHSENSHDSSCKIEDMCLSQLEGGTRIMAVTDHFDTYSYNDYDIHTPIVRAHETVCELNEKYKGKIELLRGIEISEGFWYPSELQKIMKLCDFDVIIGSVHLVRYKNLRSSYSTIDFATLSDGVIAEYLDTYFDDVITLFETTDFDILAHLTCPLRYIVGKYGRRVDLSRYKDKIDKILRLTVERKKALEVNTSSFAALGDFMPGRDIIKRYLELGGELITLGSDAHIAENASAFFGEALGELRRMGVKRLCCYRRRTPAFYEI